MNEERVVGRPDLADHRDTMNELELVWNGDAEELDSGAVMMPPEPAIQANDSEGRESARRRSSNDDESDSENGDYQDDSNNNEDDEINNNYEDEEDELGGDVIYRGEGENGDAAAIDADTQEGLVDDRMYLSKEEREWAQQIKDTIEDNPDLDNLTDFAYAQYALAQPPTQDPQGRSESLEAVIERAYQIQAFREDKKILDSTSQAKRLLKETMDIFPGFFLSIYFSDADNVDGTGGCIFVFDSTKIIAREFANNPRAYDTWVSALFYIFQAASPDFSSIRNGVSFYVECIGFDFMKNFGIKVFSRGWTEFGVGYPINWKILKHFHTSVFKNLLVSMAKRFIPQEIHSKFEVGCICELGRLDQVYLVPNETAANERFESRLEKFLQTRYENEKTFVL